MTSIFTRKVLLYLKLEEKWTIWGVFFWGKLWHSLKKIAYDDLHLIQLLYFLNEKYWHGICYLFKHPFHWDYHFPILYYCYYKFILPFHYRTFLIGKIFCNMNCFILRILFCYGFITKFPKITLKTSTVNNANNSCYKNAKLARC
jgi:hypothetical protein